MSPFYTLENLDFRAETKDYAKAYMNLLLATGRLMQNDSIGISYEDMAGGYAIFAFDLSKTSNADTLEINDNETIRISVKTAADLATAITAVFYLEYDAIFAIQGHNTFSTKQASPSLTSLGS